MYNVSINGEDVGSGLSVGELNQYLLDLHKGIKESHHKSAFEIGLGYIEGESSEKTFEDFLYNHGLEIPAYATMREDIVAIEET